MSSLIVPYKYASLDLSHVPATLMNNNNNQFLTAVSKYWYRVYKLPQLKIMFDSVVFDGKIRALAQGSNDEHMFVGVKNKIYLMRYQDCLNIFEIPKGKVEHLLTLHPYLVASSNFTLTFIYQDQQTQMDYSEKIKGIIHPPTYLNKILVWGSKSLSIINIVTQKIVATFYIEDVFGKLSQTYDDHDFITVEPSPALDVLAVSLGHPTESLVVLMNIKTLQIIQIYETGDSVNNIGFNSSGKIPIMALVLGEKIKIIELNQQALIFTYDHKYKIDWIKFVSTHPSVFVGSKEENSLKELTYDFDQPQLLSTVRERSGFQSTIQSIQFIGTDEDPHGSLNLVGSSDNQIAEIRWISLINENMNSRLSMKQNKSLQKKSNLTEEQVGNSIPQVRSLSFSINRAGDWSNLLSIHKLTSKPFLWNTENKSLNKIKVDLHQSLHEKALQSAPTAVFVTQCGNYGFIALDDGRLVKFTMQSGSHVKTLNFDKKVDHIFVDPLNQYIVVVLNDNRILQLDFFNGKIQKQVQVDHSVSQINSSKTSILLLTVLSNNSIIVWDYTELKIIRRLVGHEDKVLDAVFSYENQHVISTSADNQILIWNVVRGELIQKIATNKTFTRFDLSPNNNFLCAIQQGSRSISVFNTNIDNQYQLSRAGKEVQVNFNSSILIKPKDVRQQVYNNYSKIEEELNNQQQTLEIEEQTVIYQKIIKEFYDGRWVPLQHIDQIKDRNRVKLAEEDVNIPFFLDFRNIDQEREKLLNEIKEKAQDRSKILKSGKDKLMSELGTNFEIYLGKNHFRKLFKYLKTITPSHVDYEMRSGIFGKPQNIVKLVDFFDTLFETTDEFDLKLTYFHHFLKITRDDLLLVFDEDIRQKFQKISQSIQNSWSVLSESKEFFDGVMDYFNQIK